MSEEEKRMALRTFMFQLFWNIPEAQARAAAEILAFAAKNGLLNPPVPRP